MATASVRNIEIGYDDVGGSDAGSGTLLLIHGHPFNRSMWRPQLDALRDSGWRVIASDLRGYGETTVVPGITPLDVFASDLAALLDHLEVDEVVVGGLSMGGQIAMEFCRSFPERVRGLLLAATFAQAETEAGKKRRNETADRVLRDGMAEYSDELLKGMIAPGSAIRLPKVAEHVLRMMQTTNPEGAAAALRGRAERPPYEPVLAALDVPALIVVGDEDAFTTQADADLLHSLLRQSELVSMTGIGHMPNLESEAEFNAALLAFLSRCSSSASAKTR